MEKVVQQQFTALVADLRQEYHRCWAGRVRWYFLSFPAPSLSTEEKTPGVESERANLLGRSLKVSKSDLAEFLIIMKDSCVFMLLGVLCDDTEWSKYIFNP